MKAVSDYLDSLRIEAGLRVKELEAARVPVLGVENGTEHEVLVVSGDYLVGGLQNRMVERSAILKKGYAGPVPVRCVQQGRWSPTSDAYGYGGVSPPSVAAAAASQRGVWDTVHTVLHSTHTASFSLDLDEAYTAHKKALGEAASRFALVREQ